MSHELRTPLNAIIGFSELLSSEHLGPMRNARYLEYAHDIHSSGHHLLSIINDVLDMSKIEAGKLEIREDEVPLGPMLASVTRMVRERARERQCRPRQLRKAARKRIAALGRPAGDAPMPAEPGVERGQILQPGRPR